MAVFIDDGGDRIRDLAPALSRPPDNDQLTQMWLIFGFFFTLILCFVYFPCQSSDPDPEDDALGPDDETMKTVDDFEDDEVRKDDETAKTEDNLERGTNCLEN
mmetsp:Transcript_16059/g.36834  ORF Transcript_16059/g.36834 Transcript_16059/m.36834 type:complete len:103 (+) Transcript_16059:232-540(+)